MAKGIYWDIENLQLTYSRGTRNFCFTPIIYNQFVIEYVPVYKGEALAAFATTMPIASIILGIFSVLTDSTDLVTEPMGLLTEPKDILTDILTDLQNVDL
jgi:hypothetical protein